MSQISINRSSSRSSSFSISSFFSFSHPPPPASLPPCGGGERLSVRSHLQGFQRPPTKRVLDDPPPASPHPRPVYGRRNSSLATLSQVHEDDGNEGEVGATGCGLSDRPHPGVLAFPPPPLPLPLLPLMPRPFSPSNLSCDIHLDAWLIDAELIRLGLLLRWLS